MSRRFGHVWPVADGIELSRDIPNASLNNPKLKPHEALIDKENVTISGITEGKKPVQLIIENVQHQHSHEIDDQEIRDIVGVNEAVKPCLSEAIKIKR